MLGWVMNLGFAAGGVKPKDSHDPVGGPIFREEWVKNRKGPKVWQRPEKPVERADLTAQAALEPEPELPAYSAAQIEADDEEVLLIALQDDEETLRELAAVAVKLLRTLH